MEEGLTGRYLATKMALERCPSGLWCRSRKAVSLLASVGSNPTLSALYALDYNISRYSFSMRRGAGVADQARLESACRLLVTVGSNPTLSAFLISTIVGRPLKYSPLIPQSLGFLKLGDTPRPPIEYMMHFFFSGFVGIENGVNVINMT